MAFPIMLHAGRRHHRGHNCREAGVSQVLPVTQLQNSRAGPLLASVRKLTGLCGPRSSSDGPTSKGDVQPGYSTEPICLPWREASPLHGCGEGSPALWGSELEQPRLPLAGGWEVSGLCSGSGCLPCPAHSAWSSWGCGLDPAVGPLSWRLPSLLFNQPCHRPRGVAHKGPDTERNRPVGSSPLARHPEVHSSDNAYRATLFFFNGVNLFIYLF